MREELGCAELPRVPFLFANNGDAFEFRDATLATGTLEAKLALDQFPSRRVVGATARPHGWTPEVHAVAGQTYSHSNTPRKYRHNAINRPVPILANFLLYRTLTQLRASSKPCFA